MKRCICSWSVWTWFSSEHKAFDCSFGGLQKQHVTEVKRQENELLEARSVPLRNYLMKYVMPTVSQGLLECCRAKADDPVDFLVIFVSFFFWLLKWLPLLYALWALCICVAGGIPPEEQFWGWLIHFCLDILDIFFLLLSFSSCLGDCVVQHLSQV